MTKDEALQIFRDSGALLEGHFVLRSGLHSRQFFQCALALQQMPVVEKLGAALAAKVKSLGAVTVVAPAMGGLVIGQEVARQLGVRFIFVEKEEGKLVLRRGFKITPGEKTLIVEDVVTKGGRVQETLDIVRAHGGQIEIVSAAGEGACFRVTLPAAPNVLPTPSPQATRRGQVLIIDDEPHVAATLRQFLARDHDVTVLSGTEVITMLPVGSNPK